MPQYHFESVSLMLVDPNRDVRSSIRTSLRLEGFGEVRDTHRVDRANDWINDAAPDILIADADLLDGAACNLFHDIRHQVLGEDPFVPIIAVSNAQMPPRLRMAIDAGADHILARPVTIEGLLERVSLLIRQRKPFVVTCDYIGPDRRNRPRPGPSAPLIEVPNALRAKATQSADGETLRREICRKTAEINQRKMERNAFQIGWLVGRILETATAAERVPHLGRLLEAAEDLARRLSGTKQDHVSSLCRSLIQIAKKLSTQEDNGYSRDMKVLPHLAAAIHAAFPVDSQTVMIARDIADSVARLAAD